MTLNPRLKTIGYGLLSVFIIWHLIAISIVGPFSQSYLRDGLMNVYQEYLQLTQLNRSWPFYAPNPFFGSILRYEIEKRDGSTSVYPLTEAREKFDHAYFRFTNFYAYLFSDIQYSKDRGYDTSVARHLCSQHQGQAVQINFILLKQKRFTYEDYRQAKHPLDEEFLEKTVIGPYQCTG